MLLNILYAFVMVALVSAGIIAVGAIAFLTVEVIDKRSKKEIR